mmetsp:Transcript_85875/g.243542  ORF Transcript_85875/g.243542 Transcript_85875/m.243542 type:complete len:219 (-) Transcript_85875:72-728(-)
MARPPAAPRLPGRALQPVWSLLALALPSAAVSGAKAPVVKWGQKPDRIYLTIPLPDVTDPEVTMEERRILFRGMSRGEDYEANLKLLRGINVTESKHDMNKWSVTFDLKKLRREPCWKRLLRTKSTFQWLKKDHDRWYTDECQHAKELWRETYFTAKLKGESPNMPRPDADGKPENDPKQAKDMVKWEQTLKDFRAKAVPRLPATAKRKPKRPDQDEL